MSINQDIQPERRSLKPGDRVQLKGGEGPKMTVNSARNKGEVECTYWNKETSIFDGVILHEDALVYFADPVPGDEPGNLELKPRTVGNETLKTAIRNGRHLIFGRSQDYATLRACFDVIADEVAAHVSVG
jgi:uncharacterized protein YodC (DUF2158 family)